jgi:hypothetical protein
LGIACAGTTAMRLASEDKCLAHNNKSRTGGEATKKRNRQ